MSFSKKYWSIFPQRVSLNLARKAEVFLQGPEAKLIPVQREEGAISPIWLCKATLHLATAIIVWWKGLSNPRDYKFSTAQDPLLINADICKVERIWQEHRCNRVRTNYRKPRQVCWRKLKGQCRRAKISWIIPVDKRVMSVKATECSELSGVMLKPVFLNSLLATAALFDILPLNIYLSWGVSKLLELQLMLEGYRITLPGLTKKLYKQFMILKKNCFVYYNILLNAWCLVTGKLTCNVPNKINVRH